MERGEGEGPSAMPWSAARELMLRRITVAVSTAVSFLVGEGALRLVDGRTAAATELARAASSLPPAVHGDCREQREQAKLGELVRPSRHGDLVYELKPGLDTCFMRARVRTDADALRTTRPGHAPPARPKPPGLFRVLLLGDSQAFGWGLEDGQTLGDVLEHALAAGGATVEVVNAAVPGYNGAQEAAFLWRSGLSYQPDCVVVLFTGNDFGLPHFLASPSMRAPAGSHVLGRFARFFAAGTRSPAEDPRWEEWRAAELDFLTEKNLAHVPPEYRRLGGLSAYRRALETFAAVRRRGIPVVNFADYPPSLSRGLVRYQREAGIVHEVTGFVWGDPELLLHKTDPHLNSRGAAELAGRLAAALRRRGVCVPSS